MTRVDMSDGRVVYIPAPMTIAFEGEYIWTGSPAALAQLLGDVRAGIEDGACLAIVENYVEAAVKEGLPPRRPVL